MGKKLEAGDPKALSKHMESKGLKKLKFYCQMCQKQCTDQNGFRCHLNSEYHKNKMRSFAEDSHKYVDGFSRQFEDNFIDVLKTRFFGGTYPMNKIYMEYIKDKQHVHMNATIWTSLTEFAYHLKRKGIVEVEPADRGVQITYIDRTLQTIERQKQEEKRQKEEEKLHRLHEQMIQKQIEHAKKVENEVIKNLEETHLQQAKERPAISGPISFQLQQNTNQFEEEDDGFTIPSQQQKPKEIGFNFSKLKRTHNDMEIGKQNEEQLKTNQSKEEEEEVQESGMQLLAKKLKAEKENPKQEKQEKEEKINYNDIPWLQIGIIVKIKDKKVANGQYYKKKAIVVEIKDEFMAKLSLIDGQNSSLLIDQSFLETVIPKIGGKVKVLKPGEFQGKVGVLESIQIDNFSGSILLDDDKTCIQMPYELMSKIDESNIKN